MTRTAAHNRILGARGEAIAAAYLEEQGYRIIDRNWRNRYGELDLVASEASEHGALVAVEVKTRSGTGYGSPLSAITARKAARLKRLLLDWRRIHDDSSGALRVDAIGVTLLGDRAPEIDHLRGIS